METDIMNEILTLTVSSLFGASMGKTMSSKGGYQMQMSDVGNESSNSQIIQEMKSKYKSDGLEKEDTKEDIALK